ncbi:hypothetical protein T190130A13A_30166 [Tenacibaculum sp. 190130A14a]|uniref:Uncharacterized protein n=1 Tax=Tenacibaculum polynesiense TaxID=3137857 RepID=A0ABM9PBS3_9FLAO
MERKKSKKIGVKNFAFTKAKLHNAEHYSTKVFVSYNSILCKISQKL